MGANNTMAAAAPESPVLRSSAVLGLGQGALRGAAALYSLLLIRVLSTSEYGHFAYLVGVLGLLVALADGGFSRLLVRDVARADQPLGLIASLSIVRLAWVVAVALVAIIGIGLDVSDATAMAAILLIAACVGEAVATGFESAALGTERLWLVSIGQCLACVVLLAALVALLAFEGGLTAAIGGLTAAAWTRAGWHLARWRGIWRAREPVSSGQARRWFRQAAPFLALSLLGVAYYRIDVIILHAIRGPEETASYAAAYRLVDASLIIGGVFAASRLAHLSRVHETAPANAWKLWIRYCRITAIAAAPVVLVLMVFSEPLAALLFGREYGPSSGQDLQYLAPGILFMLLQIVNAAVLFTSDIQRLLVRMSLAHVAMNIVLTYWLVNESGSTGAALATTVSEVITFSYFGLFIWWRFGRARSGST